MTFYNYFRTLLIAITAVTLQACQFSDVSDLKSNLSSVSNKAKNALVNLNVSETKKVKRSIQTVGELVDNSLPQNNKGNDFVSVINAAISLDPNILMKKKIADAKLAAVDVVEARKNLQISSTLYGGIEDITESTKGVAVGLNASRMVYDGGMLDALANSRAFEAEAARLDLRLALDDRAQVLAEIWLELEKYENLKQKIDSRLAVLEPLIDQLEKVAKAGIGDVSKVAAAQRTVSTIRVQQTNIEDALAQARLEFANAYGSLEKEVYYDFDFIANLLPKTITDANIQKSPLLLSQYATYQADIANLAALSAKDKFNVGLEANVMRPFGGSGYDSDDSIGFVAKKTLYNGDMLESEMAEAQAMADANIARIRASFREGSRTIEVAKQSIMSMDSAIAIAKKSAQIASDEIAYLRRQLVIGGSTLDNVLSAEARLFEAESKEINFISTKRKAELTIASKLGLLSSVLDPP